jgi:hypothetical protein
MNNFTRKAKEDKERIVLAILVFGIYMVTCKLASDIGDKYFPKERYMSDDFWGWKPK